MIFMDRLSQFYIRTSLRDANFKLLLIFNDNGIRRKLIFYLLIQRAEQLITKSMSKVYYFYCNCVYFFNAFRRSDIYYYFSGHYTRVVVIFQINFR